MKKKHIIGAIKSITIKMLIFVDSLSLIKKLFISYLIIFAIPIILSGWWFANEVLKNTHAEVLNRSEQDIRQISSDVLKNIELCKNISQTAIRTKNFLEAISIDKDYTIEEVLQFKNDILFNIENILNINTSINMLRVFVKSEKFGQILPSLRSESLIINQSWYKDFLKQKGNLYWRLNHPEDDFDEGKSDGNKVVSLYRDVKFDNVHEGVIEVSMLSDLFYGNVYSDLSNKNNLIFFIKGNGEDYYNSKSDFLQRFNLIDSNLKSQLLKNTSGNEGNFKIKNSRLEFYVTYTYVQSMDVYIYQIVSLNQINNKFKKVQTEAIIIIFSIIVVLSIVTYIITSVILKKLRTIVHYMRRVQEGEMFVKIPIQGNDEIGELSMHFQVMLNKINELILKAVRKQVVTKDAEIRALHSQINAHFIYNVLEVIKMMAIVEYKYEIGDALTALGSLMRYSMNWKRSYVPLKEEIKQIENYLKLLNLRFNHAIILKIDIPDEFLHKDILKMILQPVIENAVNHGLQPRGNGGTITIKVFAENSFLNIEITDNGVGIDKERLAGLLKSLNDGTEYEPDNRSGNGIGVANVHERIKMFYGDKYGLEYESVEHEYTLARIKLPYT